MSLETLIGIALPPEEPHEAKADNSWEAVERSLGTALPGDYKQYIGLYGTGLLSDHIWVYNPFSSVRDLNLLIQVETVLNTWRHMRAEFGESECPYPIYPEPNGLLPWGHVDNGSELFWQTNGDPNYWTVAVNESRGPAFEEFTGSMSEFLARLLTGRIKSEVLPRSLQRSRRRVSFVSLHES